MVKHGVVKYMHAHLPVAPLAPFFLCGVLPPGTVGPNRTTHLGGLQGHHVSPNASGRRVRPHRGSARRGPAAQKDRSCDPKEQRVNCDVEQQKEQTCGVN